MSTSPPTLTPAAFNPSDTTTTTIPHKRTTFPRDLTSLSTLLSALPYPILLPHETGPQPHSIPPDLPNRINHMFDIVLRAYDVRKPTDFVEMRDTAGLSEAHFLAIRKRLYPDLEFYEDAEEEGEPNRDLQWRMDELCGAMSVIEGMRDDGAPAPRFGVDDCVYLVRNSDGEWVLEGENGEELVLKRESHEEKGGDGDGEEEGKQANDK